MRRGLPFAGAVQRLLRSILRRPASDWAGPNEAAAAVARAAPVEVDNRFDIVDLPGPGAAPEFDALDARHRERGRAATVAVVRDPAWRALAERLRRERAWAVLEDPPQDPADFTKALVGAFPLLSVVIVTWNNCDMNRLCLESLFARTAWPNLEVIVVDNGSSDGTRELVTGLAECHANLRVIAFDENRGFPAACNAGLGQAAGAYLALLNNDTVLTRGWASALIAHLERNPKLGIVGPVTNAIANEARVDVGYSDLGELPAWAAGWVRAHDGETFAIPMLAFFCVVMRREVFESVGGLDERFGVGMFEDGDYNRRAMAMGWEVRCARDAFVHHWQKASFRQLGKDAYFELYEENRKKYEEKWSGG